MSEKRVPDSVKRRKPIDPHKDVLGASRQAISPLTRHGLLELERIEGEQDGNVVIVLKSQVGIEVDFIRDRGALYAELVVESLPVVVPLQPDLWRTFSIGDVLGAMGLDGLPRFSDRQDKDAGFVEMIKVSSDALLKYWPLIVEAFSEQHKADTAKMVWRYARMDSMAFVLAPLTNEFKFRIVDMRYDELLKRVSAINLASDIGLEILLTQGPQEARSMVRFAESPECAYDLDDLLEALCLKSTTSKKGGVCWEGLRATWLGLWQTIGGR